MNNENSFRMVIIIYSILIGLLVFTALTLKDSNDKKEYEIEKLKLNESLKIKKVISDNRIVLDKVFELNNKLELCNYKLNLSNSRLEEVGRISYR